MKAYWGLLLLIPLFGCGSNEKSEDGAKVIVKGPAYFNGEVGGSVRQAFDDGSTLSKQATGDLYVKLPQGIVLNASFPAEVSYSVRDSGAVRYSGSVTLPSMREESRRIFYGKVNSKGLEAVLRFEYRENDDDKTATGKLDVRNFSWTQPTTAPNEKTLSVVLGGSLGVTELSLIQSD